MGSGAQAGDTEIDNLNDSVARHDDIGRLDITVDHATKMSVVERTAGLDDIPELCREGQHGLAGDYFLQALSFQILHGDKRSAARFSQLVNGNDIGML